MEIIFTNNRTENIYVNETEIYYKDVSSENKITDLSLYKLRLEEMEEKNFIFTLEKNKISGLIGNLDEYAKSQTEFYHLLSYPFENVTFLMKPTGELLSIKRLNFIQENWDKIKTELILNYEPTQFIKSIIKKIEMDINNLEDLQSYIFSKEIFQLLFFPIYNKNITLNGTMYTKHTYLINNNEVYYKIKISEINKDMKNNEINIILFGEIDSTKTNIFKLKEYFKKNLKINAVEMLQGYAKIEYTYELTTGWIKEVEMTKSIEIEDVYVNKITQHLVMQK